MGKHFLGAGGIGIFALLSFIVIIINPIEANHWNDPSTLEDEDIGCRFGDDYQFSDSICSNRGICLNGMCECYKRPDHPTEIIYGLYCECDNFSCELENELLCSGPTHGTCICGICRCELGWTGSDCQCSTAADQCFEPGKKEECSGKGICKCNRCECISTETETYSGRYCEKNYTQKFD